MRKVAVCLAGQSRFNPTAINRLKTCLIDPYDADVFLALSPETHRGDTHDKWRIGVPTKDIEGQYNNIRKYLEKSFGKNLKCLTIVEDNLKMINKNLEIVPLDEEVIRNKKNGKLMWPWEYSTVNFSNNVDVKDFDKAYQLCNEHDVLVHPKTLKEYMCNQSKIQYENQNNFKYDVVFVSRIDIDMGTEVFRFEEKLDKNTVYNYKLWECIWYGDSKSINKATEKWNWLHNHFCDKYGWDNLGIDKNLLHSFWKGAHPEGDIGLMYTWAKRGLKINQFTNLNQNYKAGVWRTDGSLYVPTVKWYNNVLLRNG